MKLKTGSGKGTSRTKFTDEEKAKIREHFDSAVLDGILSDTSELYVMTARGGYAIYIEPVELFGFIHRSVETKQYLDPWLHVPR